MTTTSPGPVTAPRPVTPVGIATQLLGSALASLEAGADPAAVRADLHRAHALLDGLEPYVGSVTTPASPALADLEARTRATAWGESGGGLEQEMLSGHVEGALLQVLVAVTGARRVLEVGMFTGYAALAMAEALPADGRLVACEVDDQAVALARSAFAASPAGGVVEVRMGDAAATLRQLAEAGEAFDLVFVDADKPAYATYLDLLLDLDLLAPGALVCVDNTLMQGEPWAGGADGSGASTNGRAIADFNARLAADPRVQQVLLPVRDGLTLVRRVDGDR